MSDMRIGIIGAMEVEVELLCAELSDVQETVVAGRRFFSGRLGEADVVVVCSGVGKVNAAVCTQALVDRFGVTHVINTGIAGSLDPGLDIGDLVVSRDCVHHDFDAASLDYAPGEVPGLDLVAFPADAGLQQAALSAAAEVAPEITAVGGRVASGDQFITDADVKARIVSTFGASCCEMEGAAIAHASYVNGIPFVVVRVISDKPGTDEQVTDYAAFEQTSAHRCARIVMRMVEGLAQD